MVFVVQWSTREGAVSIAKESAELAVSEAHRQIARRSGHVRVTAPDGRVYQPGDFRRLTRSEAGPVTARAPRAAEPTPAVRPGF